MTDAQIVAAKGGYINGDHQQNCALRYVTAETAAKEDWGCTCKPKPPQHAIEIRISIGCHGRDELERILNQIREDFDRNAPQLPSVSSCGWDGSYSIDSRTREITADVYRAELETWRQNRNA